MAAAWPSVSAPEAAVVTSSRARVPSREVHRPEAVITSYSIHYTKLYEGVQTGRSGAAGKEHDPVRPFGDPVAPAGGSIADPQDQHAVVAEGVRDAVEQGVLRRGRQVVEHVEEHDTVGRLEQGLAQIATGDRGARRQRGRDALDEAARALDAEILFEARRPGPVRRPAGIAIELMGCIEPLRQQRMSYNFV